MQDEEKFDVNRVGSVEPTVVEICALINFLLSIVNIENLCRNLERIPSALVQDNRLQSNETVHKSDSERDNKDLEAQQEDLVQSSASLECLGCFWISTTT